MIDHLLMGFHFGTCLSPDDFNFFSTVANAVDLNKRVVYGKTLDGRIVGRCLFAINDSGGILTFRRYAHEEREDFGEAVDQFADELASRMNTHLATGGEVSNLVADDWYNDGPIATSAGIFKESGELRSILRDDHSANRIEKLFELVPREMVRDRLSEFLQLPELRENAELRGEFASRFVSDELPRGLQLRVSVASFHGGHMSSAFQVLRRLGWKQTIQQLRRMNCDVCSCFHDLGSYHDVFTMLVEYNPTFAIRAIRACRPTSIRKDSEDADRARRHAIAAAHQKLGRNSLAARLTDKG